jgi:glycerate kinase
VDVQNPLLGVSGATRVYGPQKGLRAQDFELAEKCLARLARVWKRDFGKDLSRVPGAGAAGGLGFGLLAFLGARLAPGFDLFARQAGLERRLRSTDLVITGEGSIDESTLMGKGVGQISMRCRRRGIQCIGLGGVVARSGRIRRAFAQTHALTDVASVKEAKNDAAFWLERLAARVAASCGDAI